MFLLLSEEWIMNISHPIPVAKMTFFDIRFQKFLNFPQWLLHYGDSTSLPEINLASNSINNNMQRPCCLLGPRRWRLSSVQLRNGVSTRWLPHGLWQAFETSAAKAVAFVVWMGKFEVHEGEHGNHFMAMLHTHLLPEIDRLIWIRYN